MFREADIRTYDADPRTTITFDLTLGSGSCAAAGSILRHRPLTYISSRRFEMPRASWRGFLRLSLVSCPIYLSPATTRTKPIRLHQVWQPAPVDVDEDDLPDRGEGQQSSALSAPQLAAEDTN